MILILIASFDFRGAMDRNINEKPEDQESPDSGRRQDDSYDLDDLRERLNLLSVQKEMLENQVRQNTGSTKFNARTINVIIVLCIAGSFWLQTQINRLEDRQNAADAPKIAVYNPDVMELKLREAGLSMEECEGMILKKMGDEYQTLGIPLLISTGTVSYPESLSPDYRRYADGCMASLSSAQAVREINEARALRENRGLSSGRDEEPETDYWGNPVNEEPAQAPAEGNRETGNTREEWNVTEKFVTEGVVVGVEEK